MVEHTLIRYRASQTFNVTIGILLEHFCTIWTTTKVHFLPVDVQRDGPLARFFSQTAWAYDQITRFLKVFLGIRDKQVYAPLATEIACLTVMVVRSHLIAADA